MQVTKKKRRARRRPDAKHRAEFLKPEDLAAFFSVSKSTVWKWLQDWRDSGGKAGLGPQYRPTPRTLLIRRRDAEAFIERFRMDRLQP